MTTPAVVASRELEGSPDLAELAGAARDAGLPVALLERPVPDAVSIAGIGVAFEIVSRPGGATLEDGSGNRLDDEPGPVLTAASALWRRLSARLALEGDPGLPATGLAALGGFAFLPESRPEGAWAGFPGVLLRVPALAVTRVRGRSFAAAAGPGAEALLELAPGFRAPAARRLEVSSPRSERQWMEAAGQAARRLAGGEAEKVVLAREIVARGDGALSAGSVARALRAAYPACFSYLLTGADGTAFAGASPELLIRRRGLRATSQPMAGSIGRGRDEAEDELLAAQLAASSKDGSEHALVPRQVAAVLHRFASAVREPAAPEVVRLTNIQHLASTVEADLTAPAPSAFELAAALHPTPAVGGWPQGPALRMISELEQMERGWYAGAIGWLDHNGDGEFAVALRCGLLWEDGARLYAGAGIMPDSDPRLELAETEMKFRALLGALV